MYDNKYDYNDNAETNTSANNTNTSDSATNTTYGGPRTGTYTDYIGYGRSSESSDSNNYYGANDGNGNNGKHNKNKKIAGIIALLMAGILVGSSICYAIMNTQFKASIKINGEEVLPQGDKATGDKSLDSQDKADGQDGILESIFGDIARPDSDNDTDAETDADEDYGIAEDDIAINGVEIPMTGSSGTMDVAQIVEKCLPSVVAITNMSETEVRNFWGERYVRQQKSAGSGIIVDETDSELLILTNFHVVQDNVSLSVVFNGEEDKEDVDVINAVIKDYDANRDFAVIAVPTSAITEEIQKNIRVATIGDSESLKLGEQIVAIGNALGYGQSVTTGIISALNRELEPSENGIGSGVTNTYIQTDAAINPGNSGGAMFNMKGELVGVNSAKIGGSTVEGMGYAIPISDIFTDVETMMTHETRTQLPEDERGYLGVSIVDVTEDISQIYGLPQGIYISAVNPGSGAEAAGIVKEEIIVGIEGKPITTSVELKDYLAYYAKGDSVTITVAHMGTDGYEERDVTVVLGELGD